MAKFADIEPFYDWLTELMRMDTSSHPDHNTLMFYEILDTLDSLPEVLRCKDCKHYDYRQMTRLKQSVSFKNKTKCCCRTAAISTKPDDFCSYGERREGE